MSIFTRILVGTDGSDGAAEAVDLAARLAREHHGELVLCTCVDWAPLVTETAVGGATMDMGPIVDELRADGAGFLEQAAFRARNAGVEPQCHALEGDTAQNLIDLASDTECTLIVMSTHGRTGLTHLVLGSTTEAVLRRSTIPVLTMRAGSRITRTGYGFERILLGIDDSEPSDAALATVIGFAPGDRRSVVVCSVAGSALVLGSDDYHSAVNDEFREEAEHVVDAAVERARAHGVNALGRIAEGQPARALIDVAEDERADLIVLGSHGRRGLRRLFIGSVAESVVQAAPVPVLVVRTAKVTASVRAPRPATLSEPASVLA